MSNYYVAHKCNMCKGECPYVNPSNCVEFNATMGREDKRLFEGSGPYSTMDNRCVVGNPYPNPMKDSGNAEWNLRNNRIALSAWKRKSKELEAIADRWFKKQEEKKEKKDFILLYPSGNTEFTTEFTKMDYAAYLDAKRHQGGVSEKHEKRIEAEEIMYGEIEASMPAYLFNS